jgi:NAD(P)-dependent dehydrogenase (short-subunit alcohol dehydrogenase family)
MARLIGKVAVITGGSGGIGQATAQRFIAEGAQVVLVDLDAERLRATMAALVAVSGDALSEGVSEASSAVGNAAVSMVVADVSDEAQMRGVLDTTLQRHGRIDVLFCNAGTEGLVAAITDTPVEMFDQVMAVNVRGVFLGLKHALPLMQRQGSGSIIITSSVAGFKGSKHLAPYAASKHAVVGLMRSAVLETGASGVRINTIHPSPIDTRMMRAIEHGRAPGAEAAAKQAITTRIPIGRYGTADEVAATALFLASDDSRYCTGGRYSVDGGMTAG